MISAWWLLLLAPLSIIGLIVVFVGVRALWE